MNTFTKSDLKPGMVVEYDDGIRRIVLKDSDNNLFLAGKDLICSLTNFNNDLTHKIDSNFAINKVYEINSISTINGILEGKRLKLIWERPKIITLTLQEIADKFNTSPELIEIKDKHLYNVGDTISFDGKNYKIIETTNGCQDCDLYKLHQPSICTKINDFVVERCYHKIYKEIKEFTKNDLQSGMIVKTRDGHRLFVVRQGEEVILFDNYSFCGKFLQDNLTNSSNSNLDIVEVFQPKEICSLEYMLKTTNLIWKREEIKKITINEIKQKFNISEEDQIIIK